jgi:hypothetical protein
MNAEQKKTHAERLLSDPTLREALDVIRDRSIGVFKHPMSSQDEIMEAHRMVRALDAFETQLVSFVADGKISEHRKGEQHRG